LAKRFDADGSPDPTQNRYFKIQPNYAGPGQQNSRQAVALKDDAAESREGERARLVRQSRETISRSKLETHPLLGRLSLRSRMGNHGAGQSSLNRTDDVTAFYVASLTKKVIHESRISKVSKFEIHEPSGTIIIAHAHHGNGSDRLHCLKPGPPGRYDGKSQIFEAMQNHFADIAISAYSQKLLYASCAPHGSRTVLLDVPVPAEDPQETRVSHEWSFRDETIWQIATSPTGESFAVASTRGLRLFRMRPDADPPNLLADSQKRYPPEFTVVAYGRNDDTIMAGGRNGIVTFYDSRARVSVNRLLHGPGLNAIKTVDDNKIVVRGLKRVGHLICTLGFMLFLLASHMGLPNLGRGSTRLEKPPFQD
jgi:hypothetical protein